MEKKKIFGIAAAILAGFSGGFAGERPGIVCFGDSLTACGGEGGRYSDHLQQSLPEYRIINCGKGGDTLGGGLARLENDVLRRNACAVVVGLGANDYWQRKRPLNELKADYETILSRCSAAGMRIVVISCFGNDTVPEGVTIDFDRPGVPLEHYAAGLAQIERELTAKYHCAYVPDMQCGILPKGRKDLWGDSNHPNSAGNRIVADTILPELRKVLDSGAPEPAGSR